MLLCRMAVTVSSALSQSRTHVAATDIAHGNISTQHSVKDNKRIVLVGAESVLQVKGLLLGVTSV
jgi:hypothetical protein